MDGGETVSGDKAGVHPTVHVPIGWQRRVEGGQVIYVRWVASVRYDQVALLDCRRKTLKAEMKASHLN